MNLVPGERVLLAQVGVADEGHVGHVLPHVEQAPGLVQGEDIFELVQVHGRAMAKGEPHLLVLVGQGPQPLDILLADPGCVQVEGPPGRVVVI